MGGNLYETLGVGPDATAEEIERAGRKRVRETHPDAGGNAEDFDRTMRALTVLRDPLKRERYDATGDTSEDPENLTMAQAMTLVTGMFQQIIASPQVDLARTDPLAQIKRAIREELARAHHNIADTEKGIERLKKAKARLELKAPGKADWLGPAMDHQINALNVGIARVRAEIQIRDTALEIVDDYAYRVEPPAPPAQTYADLQRQMMDQMVRSGRSTFFNPGGA